MIFYEWYRDTECEEAAEKVAGTDEGFGMKVARRRLTLVEGSWSQWIL